MPADVAALPERVGRYDVVLALRTDDRGAAYLARASGLGGFDRFVVLEIAAKAFQDRPDFSKLAIDEATRIANLRHTNVVPVYDVGEDAAGVFLVTEYVPGTTLEELKSAPKDVALRILVDALAGLHAAHEHADDEGSSFNLVHGDVAPSSIVVGTDGIARIADLPLARATRRAAKSLGDRFASPERVRGEELDRRADVWSAGVLAWEILTGTAFAADANDPPRVKSVEGAGGIADEIDAAVAGALKNDKAARTATCAAFAKELSAAARAAGMLAEVDRVAEHVKSVAGPDLAKRREKIKEPKAEEKSDDKPSTLPGVSASAPDVAEAVDASAPSENVAAEKSEPKAPLPLRASLPSVPPAPLEVQDSPISVLALQVDLSAYRGDRANTALLGAVSTDDVAAKDAKDAKEETKPSEDEPEIYRSPVAVGPSTGTSNGRSFLAGPLAKHEKIALMAGGGLLVVALGIGIARCASGPSNGPSAAASGSASSATSLASASATDNTTTGSAQAGILHVTANGTIAKVAIGDRTVEVDPDTTAEIDLTPAERSKTLKVFVTSTEGRVASATVDPGVRGIEVLFSERDTLPPPPPPSGSVAHAAGAGTTTTHTAAPAGGAAKTEKRTWKKRGPRK